MSAGGPLTPRQRPLVGVLSNTGSDSRSMPRSHDGRQVPASAHVQEGGQVLEGEACREAREGRDAEQERDHPARQEALTRVTQGHGGGPTVSALVSGATSS